MFTPRNTNEHHTDSKGKHGEEQHADVRGQASPARCRAGHMDAVDDGSFQRPRSVLHGPSPIGTFLQIGIVRARVLFGPSGAAG